MSIYTEEGYLLATEWAYAVSIDLALEEVDFSIRDMLLAYSHLIDLGYTPLCNELNALRWAINRELTGKPSLKTFQRVWNLRFLPFIEPFVKLIIQKLATMSHNLNVETEKPDFAELLATNETFAADVERALEILKWSVRAEDDLAERITRMAATLVDQHERARKAKSWRMVRDAKKLRKTPGSAEVDDNTALRKRVLGC